MLLTMESKTAAQHKLELLIEKGRATAGGVVEHVMKHQPEDRLVRSKDLAFVADPESTEVSVIFPDGSGTQRQQGQTLHRNALVQMAQATDLPLKFVDALQQTGAPWGRELLAHNLNTVFQNRMPKHGISFATWDLRCAASSPTVTAGLILGRSLRHSPQLFSRKEPFRTPAMSPTQRSPFRQSCRRCMSPYRANLLRMA